MALSFEELWKKLSEGKTAGNTLYYHPCCDVWTSKNSKTKRASHAKQMPFRRIMSILDKSIEDKKQALMVKMAEEGWRIPAVLNEGCKMKPVASHAVQNTFRLYNPYGLPHNLQAGLVAREFSLSGPAPTAVYPGSRLSIDQIHLTLGLPLQLIKSHEPTLLRQATLSTSKTLCLC